MDLLLVEHYYGLTPPIEAKGLETFIPFIQPTSLSPFGWITHFFSC